MNSTAYGTMRAIIHRGNPYTARKHLSQKHIYARAYIGYGGRSSIVGRAIVVERKSDAQLWLVQERFWCVAGACPTLELQVARLVLRLVDYDFLKCACKPIRESIKTSSMATLAPGVQGAADSLKYSTYPSYWRPPGSGSRTCSPCLE